MASQLFFKTILVAIWAVYLVGCKPKTNQSGLEGYVSSGDGVLWPNAYAEVCWENPELVEREVLRFVEERVIREYNGRTDFTFSSNWQKCEDSSQGIRVFIADSSSRFVIDFGYRLNGLSRGMQLNLIFEDQVSFPQCRGDGFWHCVADDALHEFGHAIGLRHEMNRRDSPCSLDQTDGAGEWGGVAIGGFDSESVMNYCANRTNISSNLSRLSAQDVTTINQYYRSNGMSGPADSCQEDRHSWDYDRYCCVANTNFAIKSVHLRNYDFCAASVSMTMPPLDLSRIENLDTPALDIESVGKFVVGLECTVDQASTQNFRNHITRKQIEQGRLEMYIPPAQSIRCSSVKLGSSEIVGQATTTVFSKKTVSNGVLFDLENVQTFEPRQGVHINGQWVDAPELGDPYRSEGRRATLLVSKPPQMDSIQGARLNCDVGAYSPNWIEERHDLGQDTYKIEFYMDINRSRNHSAIQCSSLDIFNASIPFSATSEANIPLQPALNVSDSEGTEGDYRATVASHPEFEYPLCEANGGSGFGYPFNCGETSCAKKTEEAMRSNDPSGFCLYRPGSNRSIKTSPVSSGDVSDDEESPQIDQERQTSSFPICRANDGSGFGRTFTCGDDTCAKISEDAMNSNDPSGFCLFRPKSARQDPEPSTKPKKKNMPESN